MVGAKIAMFLMLLGLGGMNFLLVERLRANPATSINRLRRFAEVEFGIGIAIFFAAASLTSVPPAVDLTQDRVTWPEIRAQYPGMAPSEQPDHDGLALPALQAKLDAEAANGRRRRRWRSCPGGDPPPRNADDIAWSGTITTGPGCLLSASGWWRFSTAPGSVGHDIGRCCSWAGGVPVRPLGSGDMAAGTDRLSGELP